MFAYQKIRKVGGFTLVELLVAISILATISIVGYVSAHSYMMKANNSRRIASMDTLKSSLNNYYEVKKTLPEPNSNHIYYDERGTYVHSATGSYGVSGHASRDFYPAEYANNYAFDPETKAFFGYGKLTDNSAFDIATALYVDTGIYKTYLDGTYDGGRLPSLVRSYHSSDFVVQDSTEFLPYNPFELKVTAKIITWSGVVNVCTNITDTLCTASLTGELMTGDVVRVATGATALLHISDGSELSLGSTGSTTVLELKDLRYKESDNLVTKILLHLSAGEVWSEAPRLRKINENESEMQIYTTTALAAVRGTVFGVSVSSTGVTNLSLASGQIDVGKNPVVTQGLPLIGDTIVTTSPFGTADGFNTTATGGFVLSGSTSSMIVPDGGKPIVLTVPPTVSDEENTTPASTGSIDSSTLQQKLHFIPFGLGYRPVVTDVSFTGTAVGATTGILSVTFENPGATTYQLAFVTDAYDMNQPLPDSIPFLTGSLDNSLPVMTINREFPMVSGQHRTIILRLCYENLCSAPYVQGVRSDTFSYKETDHRTPRRLTCPDGQRQFARFGCQPKELVAFAPYNHQSSLSGSLGMFTWTKDQNLLMAQGTMEANANQYIPAIDSSGAFLSAGGTSCTIPSETEKSLRLLNLQNKLGTTYFKEHGIFRTSLPGSLETRGVYIDNCGTDTYMRYDLAPLDLGDQFAIETRVRGAALKRTDANAYYLWDDGVGGVALRYYKPYTGDVGKLVLESRSGSLNGVGNNCASGYNTGPYIPKYYCTSPQFNFDDNTFYTIRTEFQGTTIKFFINGQLVGSVENPTKNYFVNQKIYVGAKPVLPSFGNQWNDIIDGVKIYRLK